MPVTGASAVRKNMRAIFKDIEEKKAVQFVTAVVSIGASQSKQWAPLEYGDLINSQYQTTTKSGNGVIGEVGFIANYAAFLEFRNDWSPRPESMKEGPSANLNATPHFLRRGFEDPESVKLIDQAANIFKV